MTEKQELVAVVDRLAQLVGELASLTGQRPIAWRADDLRRELAAVAAAPPEATPSNECLKREQTGDR